MNTDKIFEKKTKKVVNTTMFEINDERRQHEYDGDSYEKPFMEFVESLGYEIEETSYGGGIVIKGVQFYINTKSASYMSRNSYTRERYVRKPQNRFVTLTESSWEDTYVLKVHINKEVDADKLRTKINKAIEERLAAKQERINVEQKNNENIIAIASHFLQNDTVKNNVYNIFMENDVQINFTFKVGGSLYIKPETHEIISAGFTAFRDNKQSLDELNKACDEIPERVKIFQTVVNLIVNTPKMPDELLKSRTHGRFNVEQWKVD